MSTKRMLLTVLAAGTVVLTLVFGSQLAGAKPPAQRPVPPGARPERSRGVTIPYPGRLTNAAGQPAPDGAIVWMRAVTVSPTEGEPTVEYWFTYENGLDGGCGVEEAV